MTTCTCCSVHNRGVHRTGQLVSPSEHLTPPDPPGLVRAKAALERAQQREKKAHEAWSEVESKRRARETELMVTWRNYPGGIKAAPPADLDELEALRKRSKELLDRYKQVGLETVDARAHEAHEQHKATQLMIASW